MELVLRADDHQLPSSTRCESNASLLASSSTLYSTFARIERSVRALFDACGAPAGRARRPYARDPNDEQVTQALVEDHVRRDPGVRAAQHGRERLLLLGDLRPAEVIPSRV
jgi:hypothetical protein